MILKNLTYCIRCVQYWIRYELSKLQKIEINMRTSQQYQTKNNKQQSKIYSQQETGQTQIGFNHQLDDPRSCSKIRNISIANVLFFIFVVCSAYKFVYVVKENVQKSRVMYGPDPVRFGNFTTGDLMIGVQARLALFHDLGQRMHGLNARFCLLNLGNSMEQKKIIQQSISASKYKDYKLVDGLGYPKQNGFYDYLQIIQKQCQSYQFVMLISNKIKKDALEEINKLSRQQQINLIYSTNGNIYEIVAFSKQAFQAIGNKNMKEKNKHYLVSRLWVIQRQAQSLALLQICQNKAKAIDRNKIFENQNQKSFLWISKMSKTLYDWSHYDHETLEELIL